MEQKELIIRLIKNDLINTYLMDRLEAIGFHSENFRLNLSDTIFQLIGIEEGNDELFEWYLEKCSELAKMDIVNDRMLLDKHAEKTLRRLSKHVKTFQKNISLPF